MKLTRFARYAWIVLAYNVVVVLWGAYVRATGSGAGCGNHWPLCGGVIIPRSPALETIIEFSHRLTSGVTLLLVVGLVIWAYRAYARGSAVRLGAALALFFTLTEALVGAGLVLFGFTAQNAAAGPTALHLTNTFLLLASLTLTAYWASGGQRARRRGLGGRGWALGIGLFAVLLLGITGAITALGDTLFPSASLAEGMRQDFSPTAHFLIRLRVFHPLIAIATGIYVVAMARRLSERGPQGKVSMTRRLAQVLTGIVIVQLLAGAVNVVLMAPVWMQILHLLLADLLWITLVLFSATLLSSSPAPLEVAGPQPAGSIAGGM